MVILSYRGTAPLFSTIALGFFFLVKWKKNRDQVLWVGMFIALRGKRQGSQLKHIPQ